MLSGPPQHVARDNGVVGYDFYGRRTRAIWFNLPVRDQKVVSGLVLIALITQIPSAICHSLYPTYLESSAVPPGNTLTLIWVLIQLPLQIAASLWQSNAEARLRRSQPDTYPPAFSMYVKTAYRGWRVQHSQGGAVRRGFGWCTLCCGKNSFVAFVRSEQENYRQDAMSFNQNHPSAQHSHLTIPMGAAPIVTIDLSDMQMAAAPSQSVAAAPSQSAAAAPSLSAAGQCPGDGPP